MMIHAFALGASTLALSIASAANTQQTATPSTDPSQDIVVTGQRASQQRAIDLKRVAIGVLDVAAADETGRLRGKSAIRDAKLVCGAS